MKGYVEFERLANDRVEALLEAYAAARLDPPAPLVARMRANVLSEARRMAAATPALETPTLEPTTSRFAWLTVPVARRAFTFGLAATLALGTGAAVLAAPPGSPFYNARLVIESALLPTQIDARLAAYESHLQARLREAEAAATADDPKALAAALAAYESDVTAMLAAVGNDPDLLARLELALAKHTAVLEALEDRVPEQASVDKAIVSSEKAIEKIREKAANRGGNGGPGGNGGNGGNGSPGARPSAGAGTPSSQAPGNQPGGDPEDDDSQ